MVTLRNRKRTSVREETREERYTHESSDEEEEDVEDEVDGSDTDGDSGSDEEEDGEEEEEEEDDDDDDDDDNDNDEGDAKRSSDESTAYDSEVEIVHQRIVNGYTHREESVADIVHGTPTRLKTASLGAGNHSPHPTPSHWRAELRKNKQVDSGVFVTAFLKAALVLLLLYLLWWVLMVLVQGAQSSVGMLLSRIVTFWSAVGAWLYASVLSVWTSLWTSVTGLWTALCGTFTSMFATLGLLFERTSCNCNGLSLATTPKLKADIEELVNTKVAAAAAATNNQRSITAADDLGITDYAEAALGACVVHGEQFTSMTAGRTVPYEVFDNNGVSVIGADPDMPFDSQETPLIAFYAGRHVGQCWCVDGTDMLLTVKLSKPVEVATVSVDVPSMDNMKGFPVSLLQDATVWGLRSLEDPSPLQLGSIHVKTSSIRNGVPQVQNFAVDAQGEEFPFVHLRVSSNHGHPSRTCLYRLRVHDEAPATA